MPTLAEDLPDIDVVDLTPEIVDVTSEPEFAPAGTVGAAEPNPVRLAPESAGLPEVVTRPKKNDKKSNKKKRTLFLLCDC